MPRCHSSGAASGAIFATRSNPVTESVIRAAKKSSTALSMTAPAFCRSCAASVQVETARSVAHTATAHRAAATLSVADLRRRRLSASQVDTDEGALISPLIAFGAGMQESVGERGIRARHALQDLRAGGWLEA